jgi:hypothetical protein
MGVLKPGDIFANATRQIRGPHEALPQDTETRAITSVVDVI